MDALGENVTNFDTPVPYFWICLLVALLGRVDGFRNRYRLGGFEGVEGDLASAKVQLRGEAQAHADSKRSYLETLRNALKYLLTSNGIGFDHRCRVTIYRLQGQDDRHLHQIFRHSPTLKFEKDGRIRVPIDEGIVGAAWGNHGVKEFKSDADPSSDDFTSEMDAVLNPEGCESPNAKLSMPSKHYYARAFTDHETGRRVGIVVYECTNIEVLDCAEIDKVLDGEALDVSRMIRHLGVLHGEFNPTPREE